MPATLTIRDETMTGQTLQEWALDFLTEKITVHELIRSRVYQEVLDHNQEVKPRWQSLVQASEQEQRLNPEKSAKKKRWIDWKEQFDVALEAFRKQQILILVNNHQVDELDEEIVIEPDTVVSFLRLTLLVGG